MVCNSGVGLTPLVNGHPHHFSAGGLYNGLVLLIDDETRTYWDHVTGEAVHGPLVGAKLTTWGIQQTTVAAAKRNLPGLTVYRAAQPWRSRLVSWFMNLPCLRGRLPPGFRATMAVVDDRLPEMCLGLGVVTGSHQRFYPRELIGDGIGERLDGRQLHVRMGDIDAVPYAEWSGGTRPMQLFSRWYGFVLTYPACDIYTPDA